MDRQRGDCGSWRSSTTLNPLCRIAAAATAGARSRLEPLTSARRSPTGPQPLGKNHVWNEPVYRYALVHNDAGSLREWILHRDDLVSACGDFLSSKLLTIDPIDRRSYEHLEYSPLVNQRAHRVGSEHRIANPVIREQYQHLLRILAYRSTLEPMDQLSVVYHLFLQDLSLKHILRRRRIDRSRNRR